MSTPYWGQLPPPKVGQTKARRLSDDVNSPVDRRAPLDGAAQGQGQQSRAANRASIQTTKSDAPTDSTMSPFVSPTTPSFPGQGLAPRPPSLPYGANQYPPELAENRRRRRSRNQEQDQDLAPAPHAPPAAPDVPRAPPVSYNKYSGVPQAQARVTSKQMEVEEYIKASTPVSQKEGHPVLDRARESLEPSGMVPKQRSISAAAAVAADDPNAHGHHRRSSSGADQLLQNRRKRASANQPSDRARMFADDRSPLQRLELTLDSISKEDKLSKEDKRARAEAAERAARERTASSGAAQQSPRSPVANEARFRERPPAGGAPASPVTPTRPAQGVSAQNGPLSQNPPDEGRRYPLVRAKSPRNRPHDSRIPVPLGAQASGIPQRNLSFRERAAKNDIKPPVGLDDDLPKEASSPVTPQTNSPAIARSGSNKLRKNPPADPWPPRESLEPLPRVAPRSEPKSDRTRAPETPERKPTQRRVQLADEDYDDDVITPPSTGKLVKRNVSQRKVEQILGRGAPHVAFAAQPRNAPSPPPAAGNHPQHRARREDTRSDSDSDDENRHVSDLVYHAREKLQPGQGIFKPADYLDEWRQATIGSLSGPLLDLEDIPPNTDKQAAWWESPQSSSRRRSSMSARPKRAEAFEGEYDDTNAPTRFKPPLYLKCGPLLRYCGIRHERVPSRTAKNGAVVDKEIWRGSIMIVTTDHDSSYDIAPTLRLFLQPIELLPPPPREINGDEPLAPEYVDPLAGHPKLGRKGETLYVRPVDHLEESKDLSRDETDEGLFEKSKSPPDVPLEKGQVDPPGSFAARRKRCEIDGEKASKYKDVRGFRLHAERGYTFWRFNIEVELGEKQQRVAYRINRGPSTGFWVPAKGQSMNIMFYSCNGFSTSVDTDSFSGPDPMWRDVLNTHQSQPFHVMIGGGDQVYNDRAMQDTNIFRKWLMHKNPIHKHNAPFPPAMQNELEVFYLERYCMWFSQGLFGMANSQIPMVNMFDDHDIIDGFGSYPHHFMNSPVFSGLGNVAFKYYMLFQHQSIPDETEKTEPSWLLGTKPGPYINEVSRSLFMSFGSRVALLAVDARTERTREQVINPGTWKKIIDRCYDEIEKGRTEHLIVLLGVPIAYPRLVWLENILTSRLLDPIKAIGKTGVFGNVLNHFDGGVEVLDDLDDHWTAKNHKSERKVVIEDLQDLAADKSVRVTILSGDVHLAAIGQFYSNPKFALAKHNDFRYIPNVISSAIVNTPPPDLMADILNKRNKVHHFDKETDEDMIPIFAHGVDGKPRNNKRMLPHRNWCSIRPYVPGNSPPSTPDQSAYDLTPSGSPPGTASGGGGGLLRRLSLSRSRGPSFRGPDGVRDRTRPPISAGILRTMSHRDGVASADAVTSPSQQRPPGLLTRTLSGSSISGRIGGLFRRRSSTAKRDDGGINGTWGAEDTEEDDAYEEEPPRTRGGGGHNRGGRFTGGLRGGGTHDYPSPNDEYEDGDESYFSAKPPRADSRSPERPVMSGGAGPVGITRAAPGGSRGDVAPEEDFAPKPFHRTPTGLSTKQLKHAQKLAVNLEGGLEVTLNVEISPKDPGGSTVPYRLVVPRLWYDYDGEEDEMSVGVKGKVEGKTGGGGGGAGGIKRLLSLRRGS
ncbi:hypothetical protein B0T16DRAFT_385993 [Cercophora newfieldiana]|uniref:PhoD-like phosphatase domain-containing protein n=1 Tax=Cercophora newfieldiana TaxID=92897 RepID=A0AA39YRW9_9PEZI|nr:hypothetical protein B0T16DRAFT_385993 [Cercophora newfieldiana]